MFRVFCHTRTKEYVTNHFKYSQDSQKIHPEKGPWGLGPS